MQDNQATRLSVNNLNIKYAQLKNTLIFLIIILFLSGMRFSQSARYLDQEKYNKVWVKNNIAGTCSVNKSTITKSQVCSTSCYTRYTLYCVFQGIEENINSISDVKNMYESSDGNKIFENRMQLCDQTKNYTCYVDVNSNSISFTSVIFDSEKYKYEHKIYDACFMIIFIMILCIYNTIKKITLLENQIAEQNVYVDLELGVSTTNNTNNTNIEMQSLISTSNESSYIKSENDQIINEIERLNINSLQNIPNQFICPITSLIMIDPVVCTDGNTYERKAISDWLLKHNTSPLTRGSCKIICENRNLKGVILDFLIQNGVNINIENTENTKNTENTENEIIII